MYSKFQSNSNFRVGRDWTPQSVSQWWLKYPINGTVGTGSPTNIILLAPGYPVLPSSKSNEIKKLFDGV